MFLQLGLTRVISFVFFAVFLAACGRSTDISNPVAFPDDTLESCGDLTPDIDLLLDLSLFANVNAPVSVSAVDLVPVPGSGGPGMSLEPGFNPNTLQYTAQVRELVEFVYLFGTPIVADSLDGVDSVVFKIKHPGINDFEEVAFSGRSSPIPLGITEVSTPSGTNIERSTEIDIVVEASISNALLFDDCDPDFEFVETNIPVSQSFSISVQRGQEGGIAGQVLEGAALLQGTSLGFNVDGEAPLRGEDQFGAGASISDTTLAVGAPGNDSGDVSLFGVSVIDSITRQTVLSALAQDRSLIDSGAVYLFEKVDDNWELDQVIKATLPDAGDQFGFSVSVDQNILVISALGEDSRSAGINGAEANNLAPDSGAVYVYERQDFDPVWRRTAYIKPPLNNTGFDGFNDEFGYRVVTDEGKIIVSAPKSDGVNPQSIAVPDAGAVFLYEKNEQGDWALVQRLSPPVAQGSARFGEAINLTKEELAIGAPGESSDFRGIITESDLATWFDPDNNNYTLSNSSSGAAYFFTEENGSWSLRAYIKAENADAGDRFGSSVASNGLGEFFVGAPLEDSSGAGFNRDMFTNSLLNSGAVYWFKAEDSYARWSFKNYLKSGSPEVAASFGGSLSADETVFVVGEPEREFVATESKGLVHVYSIEPQVVSEYSFFASDPVLISRNERFGSVVDVSNGRLAASLTGAELEVFDSGGVSLGVEENVGAVMVFE